MAASTLAQLRARLRREIRDEDPEQPVFSNDELRDYINEALLAYSAEVPLETTESLPMLTGVASYPVSDGLVEMVSIVDAHGVTYTVTDLFGKTMTVSPVPAGDVVATLKVRIVHTPLSLDVDRSTYDPVDESLILLHTRARCWETLAGDAARYFRYVEGDVDEDRGKTQKQFRDESEALLRKFDADLHTARLRWLGRKPAKMSRQFAGVVSRAAARPSQTIYKP